MRPRKRYGQHFLQPEWVARVVDSLCPRAGDVFLEIGPGLGALTLALAPRVRRVVAIEVDRDLADELRARAPANVDVVTADILAADLPNLLGADLPVRVAGNLPYNIATPVLSILLAAADGGHRVGDATVMLQREVADRLAARPGSKRWGVLSACQQLRATVRRGLTLPPGAFWPVPRVHSAVVHLAYRAPDPPVFDPALFDALVRSLFTRRRKMLANALSPFAADRGVDAAAALTRAGIDPHRRPETLGVSELGCLADVFASA